MNAMNAKQCAHQGRIQARPALQGEESSLIRAMLGSMEQPEAVVEEVVFGEKFLAVVAGGRVGLSSLLGARPDDQDLEEVRSASGRTAATVAENITATSPFRISLGLAAMNAANSPSPESLVPGKGASAEERIAELGGRVGLVGEFPFVGSLRRKVEELHLFELRDAPGAVPAHLWDETLSRLDVLAVTGTALLTRRMAYFLNRARQATVLVLGPSTPLSAALFEHGADYLCGSVVTERERVLDGIRAGLPFHQVKKNGGIHFTNWTRQDLPG